jgi:HSP20 family protein
MEDVTMFAELIRWNPFDDLLALSRQLDRRSERLSRAPRGTGQAPASLIGSPWVDVSTEEHGWHLRVALPGIAPEDVDVSVAANILHLRAVERSGDQVRALYEQSVTVPEMVDIDKIGATCRNGLLDVFLPFKEAVEPRRIEVSTEGAKQLSA